MRVVVDGIQIEGEPEDIAKLVEKLRKPVNPFEPFYPDYPEKWIPPLFPSYTTPPSEYRWYPGLSHPYYTVKCGLVY